MIKNVQHTPAMKRNMLFDFELFDSNYVSLSPVAVPSLKTIALFPVPCNDYGFGPLLPKREIWLGDYINCPYEYLHPKVVAWKSRSSQHPIRRSYDW